MKRFFKVISLFMVVILCLGSISLLFDGGSKGSGPGTTVEKECTHRDANDDILCDKCGDIFSDGCEHRDLNDDAVCDNCAEAFDDGQDLFGGTVAQLFTFSEGEDISGFYYAANKYGTKDYSNGYAKLYTTEEDAGIENDNHINFPLTKSGNAISFESVDYITLDFDIWTDDKLIAPISFILKNSEGSSLVSNTPKIYGGSESAPYFTIHGQEGYVKLKDFNGTEPIHVTFVIKALKSSGKYYPQIALYLDGEKAITTVLGETKDLANIRISLVKQIVEANKSVCLDNIQVATFGDGSGSYDGAIATAFKENGYKLTKCADSVLYIPRK